MTSGEGIYVGTELKYLLELNCSGFSMENDEFEVDIYRGNNTLHFDKVNLEQDEDGNYYVCFDSRDLGPGVVTMKVTAHVPDTDFPDGFRDEVQKVQLLTILP